LILILLKLDKTFFPLLLAESVNLSCDLKHPSPFPSQYQLYFYIVEVFQTNIRYVCDDTTILGECLQETTLANVDAEHNDQKTRGSVGWACVAHLS